jgi:2-phospho-L-lactate guanylyltransferase
MILVPVKDLRGAKQRLAPVLSQEQRTALARAMLKDVFDALARVPNRVTIAIVTGDDFAISLASRHGFDVILDTENPGETGAIEMATIEAEKRGADFTLVIPGDVPLVTAQEMALILNAAPCAGSVLVRAADGRGTNAILRRPAALFPCRFGNDSFLPHHAAARATAKPCIVLDGLPGIALDVDCPEDLAQLLEGEPRTRTQRLVRQWDIGDRLLAASGA